MTVPHPGARVAVLVAAAGAGWEAEVLDRLERGGPGLVLAKRCVDLTDLLASASTGLASAAVLAVDLPGLDADSVATLRRDGVGVVVVGGPDDLLGGESDRLLRLGVSRVLPATGLDPLADAVLHAGLDAGIDTGRGRSTAPEPADDTGPAAGEDAGEDAAPRGRLLAVWGPAGAPGRTTVAVGVAAELARAGHATFLLDVDPYGGAVAQHLGVLDEVSGLLAAARSANSGLLDADRLGAYARQVADGLRVLTGLPRADRWQEVRPAAFDDLLDLAPHLAGHVVLDTGFSLEADASDPFGGVAPQRNQTTLAAVRSADEVLVVGAADPVGLARLARGLVELRDLVPGVRPRVVVNRTRSSLGWSDREIRGMVEGFVTPLDVHFLPDDRPAADRALMAGQSLAETGDSELRAALTALARAVAGDPAPPAPGRGLRRRRAGRAR
jgi:MinD-like ATPase involved in chromosome partitioning or flagellar assembly